jgi:hypothetical protein
MDEERVDRTRGVGVVGGWESVSIDRLNYGNLTSAIRPHTHSF